MPEEDPPLPGEILHHPEPLQPGRAEHHPLRVAVDVCAVGREAGGAGHSSPS